MKNIFRFFLLLVASIGTTLLLGESFNNYFFPGSGSWIVPPEIANFVNSFSFIYYFLVPVFFIIQGGPQKWIWVATVTLPLLLADLYLEAGQTDLALSLIFFLAGTIVALGINLVWGIIQKRKWANQYNS